MATWRRKGLRVISDDGGHRCFVQRALGGPVDHRWCVNAHLETLTALAGPLLPGTTQWDQLTLYSDTEFSIVFTPFDIANPQALVIFVGLTPGLSQLQRATARFGDAIRAGVTTDQALAQAKATAAFAGPMRANLVSMLDAVGLPDAVGVSSSAELFDRRSNLADSTSALCHAVFRRGKNYSGNPPIARRAILADASKRVLAANLAVAPKALVVPLGDAAAAGVTLSGVDPRRVLAGLPHPSGANGHRPARFASNRDFLAAQIRTWFAQSGPNVRHQPEPIPNGWQPPPRS